MYELTTEKNPSTGKFSATLKYGSTVIGTEPELKDIGSANKWAQGVAQEHKWANTPADVETYSRTFSL